ncbi:MAG: phage tail protein [Puniceicoccaceae bacterium]
MSEPFIGEIKLYGFTFAPRGWALCDGQLLAIAQNQALFSLLGTIYGGDGRTSFGLPDLRGRVPIHFGQGPGLSNRQLGQKSGEEWITLTANQMPSHNHPIVTIDGVGDKKTPSGNFLSIANDGEANYSSSTVDPKSQLSGSSSTGGNQAHYNMPPFLTVNFSIALTGIYPSRS